MFDFDRPLKEARRQARQLRVRMRLRRARAQFSDLGRELDGLLRNDVGRGGYSKEARRLREQAVDLLPMVDGRRRSQPWLVAVSAAAAAMLAVVGAMMLWDESRRAATQRRLGTAVRGLDHGLKRAIRLPGAHEETLATPGPDHPSPAPTSPAPAAGPEPRAPSRLG